jgi:hypothetical protein
MAALERPLRLRAMPLEFEVRNAVEALQIRSMCNLYSITTNQAAIIALFSHEPLRRQPASDARHVPDYSAAVLATRVRCQHAPQLRLRVKLLIAIISAEF